MGRREPIQGRQLLSGNLRGSLISCMDWTPPDSSGRHGRQGPRIVPSSPSRDAIYTTPQIIINLLWRNVVFSRKPAGLSYRTCAPLLDIPPYMVYSYRTVHASDSLPSYWDYSLLWDWQAIGLLLSGRVSQKFLSVFKIFKYI